MSFQFSGWTSTPAIELEYRVVSRQAFSSSLAHFRRVYVVVLLGFAILLPATGPAIASLREYAGIVVDANGDVDARWASIRNILLSEGYPEAPDSPAPDGTILSAPGRARVGAWLMPDNASPGMLEDFAARLIPADDYLWARAAEVVDGIPDEHRRFAAGHRSKAVVHTWLAWQETPGSPMGQAIGQGSLPATAPDALRFVAWLRRLMIDDMPDPP